MTTLGRYQIFDKLGTGSMGTVYRAQDTILEREVALKTIRTEGEVDPELRERFYREARACARLQHPSIVVVYDLGEIDRVAYIAMELLNGADFRKLIQQHATIALSAKLEAMAQVCDALSYAHRQGIVHRDVKPSNLFLAENRHAKVLDFGIARLPSSMLTLEGTILGTPNYMAPEQILGKPTDARSDLFSAAVVFFEFLAYAHPFKGESIPQRIVDDVPDALGASERKLPVLLERVFARGLAKEPDRRYQTGDEFAADLRALADALLQNASPSFSRAPLPSEREVAGRLAPPDEDLCERRLSELMQLVPEFEDAIAQGDTALARQILVRLEAIGTADSRYSEPVRLCRTRLAEVKSAAGSDGQTSPQAQPAGDPGTGPRTCGYCGTANRSAAVYCIQCGARMPAGMPAAPDPLLAASPPVEAPAPVELGATVIGQTLAAAAEDVGVVQAPVVEPPRPVKPAPQKLGSAQASFRQWMAPLRRASGNLTKLVSRTLNAGSVQPRVGELAGRLLARFRRPVISPLSRRGWPLPSRAQTLSAGLIVVVTVVSAVVALHSLRPVLAEKAVGTAIVEVRRTELLEEPRSDSKHFMPLVRGTKVNLLDQIKPDQRFVRVQFVSPKKNSRPGYVQRGDLGQWFSDDARIAWDFVGFDRPGATSEEANRQFAEQLRKFELLHPGTPEADKSAIKQAEIYISFAAESKKAGKPLSERQDDLSKANEALAAVSATRSSTTESLRQQLADLEMPEAPPALPPISATDLQLKRLDGNAQGCYDAAKWACVLDAAKQIESIDPKKAKEWRETVDFARKALHEEN
jgi:serine/threonine-protein kinase